VLLKDLGAEGKQHKTQAFPRFGGTNDKAIIMHCNLEDTVHGENNVKTI